MAPWDLRIRILALGYLTIVLFATRDGARSEDTGTQPEIFSHSLKSDMAFAIDVTLIPTSKKESKAVRLGLRKPTSKKKRKSLIDVFRQVLTKEFQTKLLFYSNFFPDEQRNATTFWTNCHMFNCTAKEEGMRKSGGAFHWLIAVAMPLLTVLLLIGFTSNIFEASHSGDRFDVLPKRGFFALIGVMIGCACFALVTIIFYTRFSLAITFLLPSSWIFVVSCLIATFRCANIDFVWPEIISSPFLQVVSMIRMAAYLLISESVHLPATVLYIWGMPLYKDSSFHRSNKYLIWYIAFCLKYVSGWVSNAIEFYFAAYSTPSLGYAAWLCFSLRQYILSFYYWGDTSDVAPSGYVNSFGRHFFMLTFMVLCCFTPYARDRKFIASLGYFAAFAAQTGEQYIMNVLIKRHLISLMPDTTFVSTYHRAQLFIRVATSIWFVTLTSFLMRYQRVLPRALRQARYVRLSYLYEMRRKGVTITRCQDLPAAAFGSPAKAKHLIIVSHRWLDRYSCDAITPSHPQGLRLTTMCQRFEYLFPFSLVCSPTKAMASALYLGHDVLIFFDFMSVPQIGKMADGTLIERTEGEQLLFQEVLPAMGALYTMYPVLVCPEVCDGMPPYFSSGWCFCEWEQAKVNNNIINIANDHEMTEALAHNAVARKSLHESACEEEKRAVSYMREFETDLSTKRFFFEGDRKVVHGIVEGTLLRRLLADNVLKQDLDRVRNFLKQLSDRGLSKTIDYAVDHHSLDTLLHIAMRLRSKAIVDALVAFGADTERPNYRGDVPGEFFMISTSWLHSLR